MICLQLKDDINLPFWDTYPTVIPDEDTNHTQYLMVGMKGNDIMFENIMPVEDKKLCSQNFREIINNAPSRVSHTHNFCGYKRQVLSSAVSK